MPAMKSSGSAVECVFSVCVALGSLPSIKNEIKLCPGRKAACQSWKNSEEPWDQPLVLQVRKLRNLKVSSKIAQGPMGLQAMDTDPCSWTPSTHSAESLFCDIGNTRTQPCSQVHSTNVYWAPVCSRNAARAGKTPSVQGLPTLRWARLLSPGLWRIKVSGALLMKAPTCHQNLCVMWIAVLLLETTGTKILDLERPERKKLTMSAGLSCMKK